MANRVGAHGVGTYAGDGVCYVDFNAVIDRVTGEWLPEARDMATQLGTFGELSFGGYGAHFILFSRDPPPQLDVSLHMPDGFTPCPTDDDPTKPRAPHVEFFPQNKFVTFSGRHLDWTPATTAALTGRR